MSARTLGIVLTLLAIVALIVVAAVAWGGRLQQWLMDLHGGGQ